MKPRIGIVGAGRMGTTHSKAVHYLAKHGIVDAELVGIAEQDAARREPFAWAAHMRIATPDADELIASPDVNTVYICTPTFNHRELAEKVAAAGKALFCEKPLAFNATDAQAMLQATEKAGVPHQVGLVMRFSAVMNVTRSLLRDPEFGRAMTGTLVDDQFFPIQGHYASTWRGDVTQVGAGTLLEHAIHDVDILVSFFGKVSRVQGVIRNFAGKFGVEDVSNAILEFADGTVFTHVSTWHNILHRGSSRRFNAICENAQFSWDDNDWSGEITIDSQPAGERLSIPSDEVVQRHVDLAGIDDERLRAVMTAQYAGQDYLLEDYRFLRALVDGRQPGPGFDVAVYAHRVVDAIYESAAESRPVIVE